MDYSRAWGVSTKSNKDSALSDGVLRSPRKGASSGFGAFASYPPGSSFLSQVLCSVRSGDPKVTQRAHCCRRGRWEQGQQWGTAGRLRREGDGELGTGPIIFHCFSRYFNRMLNKSGDECVLVFDIDGKESL